MAFGLVIINGGLAGDIQAVRTQYHPISPALELSVHQCISLWSRRPLRFTSPACPWKKISIPLKLRRAGQEVGQRRLVCFSPIRSGSEGYEIPSLFTPGPIQRKLQTRSQAILLDFGTIRRHPQRAGLPLFA